MTSEVHRSQMERFAQALLSAALSSAISEEEFKALHRRFRAQDRDGTTWTVGIRTLEWHRLVAGQWFAGLPPDILRIDQETLDALQNLPAICPRCRGRLKPGKQFCPNCGQPVVSPAPVNVCPNPMCGKPIAPGKKFCPGCGTPVQRPAVPA